MKILENIEVNNYSVAEANWEGLGKEYDSSSFYALKEFFDNSFSAANTDDLCQLKIILTELDGGFVKVDIEDNSMGVWDVDTLLSIGSLSKNKKGIHNIYGSGIKNALAFFLPKWRESHWLIQSKTKNHIELGQCIQVRGPYYYPHEYNEFYNQSGINAHLVSLENFQGEVKDRSGTYIQFVTPMAKFVRMSPLSTSGRPILNLEPAAEKLRELVTQWYAPKIKKGEIRVEISFKSLFNTEYTAKVARYEEYPIYESLGSVVDKKVKSSTGGEIKVTARWFAVDRNNSNFLVPPKYWGVVCYVNGVLVDPFIWIDEVFGQKWNGGISSVVCLVEVEGEKIHCPEISPSKTKFDRTGLNFDNLITFLQNNCPKIEIANYGRRYKVESESVKITQYVESTIQNPIFNGMVPQTQVAIELNNSPLTGNDCRYDVVHLEPYKVTILEFKKGKINPEAVYQANAYHDLALEQYRGNEIKLVLAGESITPNAKKIIDTLRKQNKDISYKSFADLGLPK